MTNASRVCYSPLWSYYLALWVCSGLEKFSSWIMLMEVDECFYINKTVILIKLKSSVYDGGIFNNYWQWMPYQVAFHSNVGIIPLICHPTIRILSQPQTLLLFTVNRISLSAQHEQLSSFFLPFCYILIWMDFVEKFNICCMLSKPVHQSRSQIHCKWIFFELNQIKSI